ncbi:MAG: glycoside hydrolase family 2 TIM barrel-domain containing protein, partial [Paracoccaceae bacterium]
VVATGILEIDDTLVSGQLTVPTVLPWSPDAPNLYTLQVAIVRDGVLDATRHTFGFRSIVTRDGKILINGQPFFMRAALDQDYYPEGICTPPSLAFLEDQLMKAKALGLNMLRCHIKIPDPRYYEVADRLGMLIWTEIPNVATFTKASAQRMRDTMQGILTRDGNHPCIVIWTLINEDWGTRLCGDPSHRAWLKETYDWLKALDPTRLVVDNSPCNGNFHVKSDLDDFHYYRSVPERRAEWDQLTREFAGGAAWTYTPFGDGVRTGTEPKIVSEFGVWGLPDPARVTLSNDEPWWMETGGSWGEGVAYPHGIQGRFAGLGLNSVFGNFENFIVQAQWYQFANLKYQIEVMRSWPQIQGYVITEFTDVHWESNGLLDMNRNPRVFHDRFGDINDDVVIVPRVPRYSGVARRDYAFGLAISTGGRVLAPSVLKWRAQTGEGGEINVPATPALDVVELGNVRFLLPLGTRNQMVRIDLTLVEAGTIVAQNTLDIAVYLPRRASHLPTVGSRDRALADYVRDLGYKVTTPETADVTLSRGLDAQDIARMQGGARYLILADGSVKTQGNLRVDPRGREQPFIKTTDETPGIPIAADGVLPNINLTARHGTMWRGDWIAGFSWIRRDGAFADMPGGPLIDMSFDRVVPHHVMTGFRTWEFGGPVHAGIVVGWVHKPAALIAERRVGKGVLVASTFRLMTEAAGADPVASYLFDALARLASDIRTEI